MTVCMHPVALTLTVVLAAPFVVALALWAGLTFWFRDRR